MDGPVIESDIFDGTNWKTIAIGTTGAGAAGIFAIDVTDPVNTATGVTNMGAGNLKWDIVPFTLPTIPWCKAIWATFCSPASLAALKIWRFPIPDAGSTLAGNGYESVSQNGNSVRLRCI